MAATAQAVPTLSQIQAWSTDHLEAAATQWQTTADTWEHAFTQIHREAPSPGGTPWIGAGADAALLRTGTDRTVVVGAAEGLYAAANAARYGAGEIAGARELALQAVSTAQAAGFVVREDLSIASRQPVPAALQATVQVQVNAHAANIRTHAAALLAIDGHVAADISAAIAAVQAAQFGNTPLTPATEPQRNDPTIQLVDNHTIQDAPPPGDPLAGWSEEQKQQVAHEIAAGHAAGEHGDEFPGMSEDDMARWIYHTMNDPTVLRRSTPHGSLGLYRDGAIVFIDPKNPDYGTVFRPTGNPFDYFMRATRDGPPAALPPPPPGRLPPLPGNAGLTPVEGNVRVPDAIEGSDQGPAFPNWGTQLTPEQARDSDGQIGILQKFIDAFGPPPPPDPRNQA